MNEIQQQLVAAFQQLATDVVAWTPKVVLGVLLAVGAFVLAKIVEAVLRTLLRRLGVDGLLGKLGVDATLKRLGMTQAIHQIVPRFVYYLLLFLFARTAADALGLVPISSAIGSFMGYLPNLFAALMILLLGSAAAQFAGKTVAQAAENSGIEFASSLGTVVSALLLFVAGVTAVGQLRIDTDIVRLVTAAGLGGIMLAFGLSFGLGTRDITRNIIAGFYARKTFPIGAPLEIRGERGVLTAITPTQTLLERDGVRIAVSNSVFLEEVVKQGSMD